MGLLLREILKTLCGVNQWCYAVFWKIGCQNPKLLIWEECHYEGSGTSDMHSSQLKVQSGVAVHFLINKMIINNQVNVVGQGVVGRAAFTGNHEWILAKNFSGDAHPPEVLTELHQQFSAGMQTIAIIPVSPHGVVQLGSSLTIMENMGFVSNVKSLILQLGCVPGALLSDNLSAKESTERIGVPVSFGVPDSFSVNLSGNRVPTFARPFYNGSNKQSILFQAPRTAQPSCYHIGQFQDNIQSAASTIRASNLNNASSNSCNSSCEVKFKTSRQDDPFIGLLENATAGAEVIPSNPNAWLNQHAASFDSRPAFNHQSGIGQLDVNNSIQKLLEQNVPSDIAPQAHVNENRNAFDMMTVGDLTVNSCGDSLTSRRELHKGSTSQMRPTSIPPSLGALQNPIEVTYSSAQLSGVGFQHIDSSRTQDVPVSSLVDQLSSTGMLSGGSHHSYHFTHGKHVKTQSTAEKGKMDDDLFQALTISSSQPFSCIFLDGKIHGSVPDCLKNSGGSQDLVSTNIEHKESCPQPLSGDDLYDILGLDFKKQLPNSEWDSLLADVSFANLHMGKDASVSMDGLESSSDVFSVNHGVSDSSFFSGLGTDNLLDAVVSRAHSTSKQSSDDVSCKTTTTKIMGSFAPGSSSTYRLAQLSDQVKQESSDLPKSVEKSGTVAPGSNKSGCSKDEIGTCSQITSAYGSQLSSWVGHSMRRESSVSTAYSKKNDDTSKPNRKRLKPGENPRPRPKDRQMIQDRVKELREIVPNGAKCSIDALLERTIKHMLFLQSVTKHADKLKQTGESKIIKKEGGLLLEDSFGGGATWAFEVGSQSMVCPIIVEDLNPPRQMLVEMLCEERGFFLEIADLIRGLGLTILKGVMEAQNDKIWARFAVEANRDITRMEVFMSLVRLLEQTMKGGASSAAALEKNTIIHHAFSQAASIPATGRPNSLQ